MAPVGQESVVNETTVCPNNFNDKVQSMKFCIVFPRKSFISGLKRVLK